MDNLNPHVSPCPAGVGEREGVCLYQLSEQYANFIFVASHFLRISGKKASVWHFSLLTILKAKLTKPILYFVALYKLNR